MKEIVERKLKELNESYDMWLKRYDKEGLRYQEKELYDIKAKIRILEEILKESRGVE